MLSADGELLCFTDRKRLKWYIAKGLAEEVKAEPSTVRLTFQHRDEDQRAGTHEFYTAARINRCVACGEGQHYLRYRIVPACYRKAFPPSLKSHRSHDVVLLCVSCHEIAQAAAERTKHEISVEYGIPLFPPNPVVIADKRTQSEQGVSNSTCDIHSGVHPYAVRKAALALHHSRLDVPDARRKELQAQVRAYVRAVEPWLAYEDDEPLVLDFSPEGDRGLSQAESWAGLLAGLGPSSRRRTIRRWISEGHTTDLPHALLDEVKAAATRALSGGDAVNGSTSSTSPIRDFGTGHAWHGRQVVHAAQGRGELEALSARFRKTFVDALLPKHLPEGWAVDHKAPRAFGEHSVYSSHIPA